MSTVPPVKPKPLPDIFATGIPSAAIIGSKTIDTLSPTPPVECLSTVISSNSDKSKISPEFAIANVKLYNSSSVIPLIYIAITSAAA